MRRGAAVTGIRKGDENIPKREKKKKRDHLSRDPIYLSNLLGL